MKSCIVPPCLSNSIRNPNFRFFNLPSDKYLRQEWMEVLSVENASEIAVCELHFREKDFTSSGRLKPHAIPTVKAGKFNDKNSDEEFMHCGEDSGSDLEVIEVKNVNKKSVKIKQEPIEESKPEKKADMAVSPPEVEMGRRPSRRAAQLAAQKIQNTVRQYGLAPDSMPTNTGARPLQIKSEYKPRKVITPPRNIIAPPRNLVVPQRNIITPPRIEKRIRRDQKVWHRIRAPVPDIDLTMECHEELLSPIQAETILKAQTEYNTVMRRLRNLKASNVRIICVNGDENELPISPGATTPTSPLPSQKKVPHVVSLSASSSGINSPGVITVVPVHLVTVQAQSLSQVIKPPSSPAIYANITAD